MNKDLFSSISHDELLTVSTPLLQQVLDAVPLAIYVVKPIFQDDKIVDLEQVLVNKEAERYQVYHEIGNDFSISRCAEIFDSIVRVIESGREEKFEQWLNINDDKLLFQVKCIKFNGGGMLLLENTTGEEMAAKKLEADELFIGRIMDATPEIIYLLDLNTHQLIYANRQVARDLGYTQQQIERMKNPVLDLIYAEDKPAMEEHLRKMKTVTQDDKILEIEYRMVNAKGELQWYCDRNIVFRRNASKIPVEKLGISQNINTKKLQEQQVLTSHDIIEQAEEIIDIGNWEYDIATGNFKWSEGMYRLFNLPPGKKVTPAIYLDYSLEDEYEIVNNIVNCIQHEYAPFEEVITLIVPGEEKRVVKIKAVAIFDDKKKPAKMVGVDLDITEQITMVREMDELNKMLLSRNNALETLNRELKTFNTIAAKDYKETLQVLYTNFEYIVSKEARNLSDTARANIRKAQAAIQKMKLLTEDINRYLHLYDVEVNKSLVNPDEILEKVLYSLKSKIEQTDAKIECGHIPPFFADPDLFGQLLVNLVENSLKFRKLTAPVIKIKYSKADERNAVRASIKNPPYIIISVSDNGIGFTEDEAEKIFELFFRIQEKGKHRGSGIGLAICKKIMKMHDGFIVAESSPGIGSTFNCYFPLKENENNSIACSML